MKTVLSLSAIIFSLGLSGCATTSNVVPIGNQNYEISGQSAWAWGSGGEQKVRLIGEANAYCSRLGKQATVVDASGHDGHMGSFASVNGQAYGQNSGVAYGPRSGAAWSGRSQASVSGFSSTAGVQANADVIFRCE